MTEELFCYDCKRPANTECKEQKHRMNTEKVEGMGEEQQWHVGPMKIHGWAIHDAAGNVVVQDIYDEEIARFIVRAVNAHEWLVEACKKAKTCATLNSDVRVLINAALALAEKEI